MSNAMSPQEVRGLSPWQLARLASCGEPDTDESPGAPFLQEIRDEVVAMFESVVYDHGLDGVRVRDVEALCHDTSAEAIDTNTHGKWCTFVDLAAYLGTLGTGDLAPSKMDDVVDTALCTIGDRLVGTLARMLVEWASEQDTSDDEG